MKAKLIFGSIVGIAIAWLAYALITLCCLSCGNVLFYLIPHVVFGVLFVSFLCLSGKEADNKMKDCDLDRKITWEIVQFTLYEKKKKCEDSTKKLEKPLDTEKLSFNQLLVLAKRFKKDADEAAKKEMETLRKDIDMLKSKKDLTVEITQTMLNKSEENSNLNTLETNE